MLHGSSLSLGTPALAWPSISIALGPRIQQKLPLPAKSTAWKWKLSCKWKCIALTRPIWVGWDGGTWRAVRKHQLHSHLSCWVCSLGANPFFFPQSVLVVFFFFFFFYINIYCITLAFNVSLFSWLMPKGELTNRSAGGWHWSWRKLVRNTLQSFRASTPAVTQLWVLKSSCHFIQRDLLGQKENLNTKHAAKKLVKRIMSAQEHMCIRH